MKFMRIKYLIPLFGFFLVLAAGCEWTKKHEETKSRTIQKSKRIDKFKRDQENKADFEDALEPDDNVDEIHKSEFKDVSDIN